ncbi:hypothetical protein ACFQZZ_19155 [Nocardia sp. GCM10030253]|uniref:hypothetical protein n=1 Tax=Nocardia sp. GCM10030253 TaxID=3273404 RepID=UPI003631AD36
MSYNNPYKLFLPQHTPSKHRVVAVYHDDGWDELKAIATFERRWEAVRLADALNDLLQGVGLAREFLTEAIAAAPGPVRAEVERIAKTISANVESDLKLFGELNDPYLKALVRPSICGVMRFPVTSAPHDPSGNEISEDELSVLEEDDYFRPTIITPRTAEMLRTSGCVIGDEVRDKDFGFGENHLPESMHGQKAKFYQRLARCFDNLVDDLERGDYPLPRSMAEEIALWSMLADARTACDELDEMQPASIRDLPESEYDYNFQDLEEALYQDHDFHGLLYPDQNFMGLRLDEIFEPFQYPPPRPRKRPTAAAH